MSRTTRLLLISFLASFTAILVERGIYFYTDNRLGFTPSENLWLALGVGLTYIVGALLSHRAALRFGDRKFLLGVTWGSLLCHIALAAIPNTISCVLVNLVLAAFIGCTWPLMESYVSAGHGPKATADALGKFGIAWASAVPLAMVAAGQLIAWNRPALFVVAGLITVFIIVLASGLEARPSHLHADHPDRPPPQLERRYSILVVSARWSLVCGYTLLFLLVPLMPTIFEKLGLGVRWGMTLAALIDFIRVIIFAILFLYQGWHGKAGMLICSAICLPIGFFLVLLSPLMPEWIAGQPLATAIIGEIIFGAGAAAMYFAALYYAMAVSASVESGGAHESLIGSGFALGPAIGLIGVALAGTTGGENAGMVVAAAPVMVICLIGALWPMRRLAKPQAA